MFGKSIDVGCARFRYSSTNILVEHYQLHDRQRNVNSQKQNLDIADFLNVCSTMHLCITKGTRDVCSTFPIR
jgi:hypothetical protein